MTLTSDFRSVFAAGSGFFRSSGVVVLVKAIALPSGDQTGAAAPFGRSVTARASPPPSGSSQICGVSFSSGLTNASHFSSGDQRGDVSLVPLVSRCGAPSPDDRAVKIAVSYLLSF